MGTQWLAGGLMMLAMVPAAAEDARLLVELPPQTVELMREDMRHHLNAFNGVLGLVAEGRLDEAGELAEQQLGFSAMGRFRGNPWAPGQHMTPEMRGLGRTLHQAASAFADATVVGDLPEVLKALKRIGDTCVACHAAFRVR